MCLEAARGPKCCLIFSKCLEPQILVFEGGQESTLHCYPAAMSAVCSLQVRRQPSTQGVVDSFGRPLHCRQALMEQTYTIIHCKRLSLAPRKGKGQRKSNAPRKLWRLEASQSRRSSSKYVVRKTTQ